MAVARRSRAASLGKTRVLRVRRLGSCWTARVGGAHAAPVGLGQRDYGEALGDGVFEPRGALRRALDVSLDDAGDLGLGAGAVRGVPDGAQLAANGLSHGDGGGEVDGVADEVEPAALPDRAGKDGLAGGPDVDLGGRRGRRW